jgi:hypothetical protein
LERNYCNKDNEIAISLLLSFSEYNISQAIPTGDHPLTLTLMYNPAIHLLHLSLERMRPYSKAIQLSHRPTTFTEKVRENL